MHLHPVSVPADCGQTVPMGTEIERKFLLDGPPAGIDLGDGVHMRQGYVAEDGGVSVRVRVFDDSARLTIKAGTGVARTEVELDVPVAEAEQLWPFTAGRRVDKTRHRVVLVADDLVAEVDRFHDALDGLWVVEVEFDSVEASERFAPPAWFGREVTGDHRWTNLALSRQGRPD